MGDETKTSTTTTETKPAETTKEAPAATKETTTAAEQTKPAAEKSETDAKAAEAAGKKEPAVEKKDEPAKDSKTETKPKGEKEEVKFDLKLPKGSKLAASTVDEVTSFAKERGLSNDQAQAILDRESQKSEASDKANRPGGTEWKARVEGWEKTIQSDPEVGGEAMKENAELAKRVIDRFGNDTLKKALQETGFGSHPDLFRFCVKVGKAMGESKLINGDGAPSPAKRDTASKLFDHKST